VSPYAAINYLLFRAYEAAKQLVHVDGERIAVVIVDEIAWSRFALPWKQQWIDWGHPHFVGDDRGWREFIETQRKNYPDLPGDVPSTMHEVAGVWILKQPSSFEFSVVSKIPTSTETGGV
jgi:hypothetical protein